MSAINFTRTNQLTADILLKEVELELEQARFMGRTHGKPATFRAGCRGHLCRYKERTRRRQMRHKAALQELPIGVQPDVRPRDEQRWDDVFASICESILTNVDDVPLPNKVVETLDKCDVARYAQFMEALRVGQLPRVAILALESRE